MPSTPCIRVAGLATTLVSAPRPKTMSAMARRRMFTAVLPSKLLTASGAFPAIDDVVTVASSGSEVMPPSSNMPAKA